MDAYFEGYKIYYCNNYPAIYKDEKMITIHTIIMERKLGRQLKTEEVVHHIDENKCNYSEDNLICFATVSDHTAFHKGKTIVFDKEGIAYCDSKSISVDGKKNRYNICPNCGKLKSYSAILCKACYLATTPLAQTANDLEELKSLLETDVKEQKNITEIANQYEVSSTTIKKWFKKCGLVYQPSSCLQTPPKDELEQNITSGSLNSVARLYGVDKSTVKSWLSKYNIPYSYQVNKPVKCLTTNEKFNSLSQAAKSKYPKSSVSRVKKHIKDACEQNTDYKGLYWAFA